MTPREPSDKKTLWLTPRAPGKLFQQVAHTIEQMGFSGVIEVTTPDIMALSARLKECESKLIAAQLEIKSLKHKLDTIIAGTPKPRKGDWE